MVNSVDKHWFDFQIENAHGSVTFEIDVIIMDEFGTVDFDLHFTEIWSFTNDENGHEIEIKLTGKQEKQIENEIKEFMLDNPDVFDFYEYISDESARKLCYYYELHKPY